MQEPNYITVKQIENGIVEININRITAMNAINSKIIEQLQDAIEQIEQDKDIACVILTGEAECFIAGVDIREINGASVTEVHDFSKRMKTLHQLIVYSEKTFIAAISGYCLGGGLEFALACDIRIADKTAKFGFPEINIGIIPGGGGIYRLMDLAGTSFTSQLLMTGEMIDAEQAQQVQLINTIAEDVLAEAISIARTINSKSRPAIIALKKLISQRKLQKMNEDLETEMYELSLLFDQSDTFEGISAFIEKRKPEFKKGV